MPNSKRGEMDLEVGDRTYLLRSSFDAMTAIEDATDKGVGELLLSVATATFKFRDAVMVLWVAARRSGNKDLPSFDKFGELLRTEVGAAAAGSKMREFLSIASASDQQLADAEEADKEPESPDPSKPGEKSPE